MLDLEQLTDIAQRRIARTPGFADLADFYVSYYTLEELDELGIPEEDRDWVGQYVRGSIDSPKGAIVLINLAAVEEDDEDSDEAVISSICHEMGHALWTLLDKTSQSRWRQKHKDAPWGAEEAFADDFMWLTAGSTQLMRDEELFHEITKPGA